MSAWGHLILEGFCMYPSMSQKVHTMIELEDNDIIKCKEKKRTKRVNKNYIPKTERPNWCNKYNKERIPQFRCMDYRGKKCPFFAYCDADKKDYKLFNKVWEEKYKNEKNNRM